jgi:hypothetical protein
MHGPAPRLIPESKMKEVAQAKGLPPKTIPRVPHGDSFRDWFRACKDGKPSCSDFAEAGPLNAMVVLGNLSLLANKAIHCDVSTMKVEGIPETHEWITPKYLQG